MGQKHIDFGNWEADGPLDEEHLKTCASCREELQLARFLRSQLGQVPSLDVPPFFAARVSRLATAPTPNSSSFWVLVEASAKRLMPGFAVLVLILLFFTAGTELDQPSDEELWAALFPEPQISQVETLDDVLLSLRETLEEESEGQY